MKYTEKIDKYLDGEMTKQEATAFEQQVKTNPDLAYEVKLHQLAVAGIQHSEEARFQEFKSRMKAIESEVKDETPIVQLQPQRGGAVRWAMRIAAGILVLIAAYFLLRPVSNPITQYAQKIAQIDNTKGTDSPTPIVDFDRAKELYRQEKQNEALQALTPITNNKALEYRYQAMLLKADILYEQGNKEEALDELRKITAGDDISLRDIAEELIEQLEK